MKKINILFYYTFLIIYLEFLTKLLINHSLPSIALTLINSFIYIFIIFIIATFFNEKINKILSYIFTILFTLYFGFHYFFYHLFSNIFSFNTINLTKNVIDFKEIILFLLHDNLFIVFLYLIPLIIFIILKKHLDFKQVKLIKKIGYIGLVFVVYGLSLLYINFNKNSLYSPYNLYYNINNEFKTIENFGLLTYTKINLSRVLWGFDEKLNLEEEIEQIEEEKEIVYNKVAIDFDKLIEDEENETIKNALNYLKESEATKQNKYTGYFKNKNLIFILAEGFNSIAVSKELTPTLYELTHEGFIFNNFYSPVFLSTTGGEFQATTGLIPTQEVLANWKKNLPTISYALGNSFKNLDYKTNSYHNWTYTYYSRNKTMKTLGYDNYMGCGNGLEKSMSCTWLPSDIDLINTTLPLYQDENKFLTYYVSVSGHAPYVYNSSGNSIALKNKDLVKDLPYSDNVKAYLATQIEFDRALDALIKGLKKQNKLDDTVIAIVADHYPYTLNIDEINEISTYERDELIEVNHSNFIIWNSEIKSCISIDKVGSQIDVLPTLLNLFGITYDSRLIVGKDILSDYPGLAVFSNRSWINDYGIYKNGVFIKNSDVSIDNEQDYIKQINKQVADYFTISGQIIKYDLYNYILK